MVKQRVTGKETQKKEVNTTYGDLLLDSDPVHIMTAFG